MSNSNALSFTGGSGLAPQGVDLYLVVDRSGSMEPRAPYFVPQFVQGLEEIRRGSEPGLRVAQVFFGQYDQIEAYPDSRSFVPVAADKVTAITLPHYLELAHEGRRTAIIDALLITIDQAILHRTPGRAIRIVIITDGMENGSKRPIEVGHAQVERAHREGIFVGIVGFVLEHEESTLRAFAEKMGIRPEHIIIHAHKGDEPSVRRSVQHSGATMMSMSLGGMALDRLIAEEEARRRKGTGSTPVQ